MLCIKMLTVSLFLGSGNLETVVDWQDSSVGKIFNIQLNVPVGNGSNATVVECMSQSVACIYAQASDGTYAAQFLALESGNEGIFVVPTAI